MSIVIPINVVLIVRIQRRNRWTYLIIASTLRVEPVLDDEDEDEYKEMNDTIVVQQWCSYQDILEVKPPSSDVKMMTISDISLSWRRRDLSVSW